MKKIIEKILAGLVLLIMLSGLSYVFYKIGIIHFIFIGFILPLIGSLIWMVFTESIIKIYSILKIKIIYFIKNYMNNQNKKRNIFILAFTVILALFFYWIFVRPVVIRKRCYQDSKYISNTINGMVEEVYGDKYKKCLMKNGLKFE